MKLEALCARHGTVLGCGLSASEAGAGYIWQRPLGRGCDAMRRARRVWQQPLGRSDEALLRNISLAAPSLHLASTWHRSRAPLELSHGVALLRALPLMGYGSGTSPLAGAGASNKHHASSRAQPAAV